MVGAWLWICKLHIQEKRKRGQNKVSRTYAHTPAQYRNTTIYTKENSVNKSERNTRKGELLDSDFNSLITNLTRSTRNLSELLDNYYEN